MGVLSWRAQPQQVKNGLDIRKEPIVTLTGKGNVAVIQRGNGLAGVPIEFGSRGHAALGRVFTVVALVIERRGIALIVRRYDALPQQGTFPVR